MGVWWQHFFPYYCWTGRPTLSLSLLSLPLSKRNTGRTIDWKRTACERERERKRESSTFDWGTTSFGPKLLLTSKAIELLYSCGKSPTQIPLCPSQVDLLKLVCFWKETSTSVSLLSCLFCLPTHYARAQILGNSNCQGCGGDSDSIIHGFDALVLHFRCHRF